MRTFYASFSGYKVSFIKHIHRAKRAQQWRYAVRARDAALRRARQAGPGLLHPVVLLLLSLGSLCASPLAVAHPLGNFSISHYTRLGLRQEAIELHYILDLAEIPTFQELQEASLTPQADHPGLTPYLARRSAELLQGLHLEVNGQRLDLQVLTGDVRFAPGAGGLPTMQLRLRYRAAYAAMAAEGVYHLGYRDHNFPGRAGWQEIVAVAGPHITLVQSSVPEQDRSQALSAYPTDLLNSPPQVLAAVVLFRRGGTAGATGLEGSPPSLAASESAPPQAEGSAALAPATSQQTTPRSAFTTLIAVPQLSAGVVLLALGVAVGLGALHALEPGHGKTVVAAYLVGTRGTARHALYLGLVVTATHTAGVYVLGAVTLYASHYVVPERLYPWLGVLSGVAITGLGGYLLRRRYAGLSRAEHAHGGHHHSHAHVHGQDHWHHHPVSESDQHTAHGGHHHHHLQGETVTFRELLTLGVTGGIVPCPAALVVLLSAVAMHRIGFGLLLIVAFSVGLAAVLIAVGLLMVYARQFMTRFQTDGPLLGRWLPLASAAAVTLFGVIMIVQALVTASLL